MSEKILDFLTQAANGNALEAEQTFKELISQKVQDRLEDIRADVMFKEEVEIDEAIKLGSKVLIHKGPKDVIGKVGFVGEIRKGLYKGAPKTYTVDHDKGSIQLGKEHIKLVKENEEFDEETLDELSKKTLGSYVNKAASHATNKGVELGSKQAAADEIDRFTNRHMDDKFANSETMKKMVNADNGSINKVRHKAVTRLKGISTAVKKLTKENAELMGLELSEEELDELSKKTLASYATKASSSSHKNSTSNLSSRAAYKLATNGEDDGEKEDRKSFMRSKGIATAIKKLTKENAELMGLELSEEELDELSKKTLSSYLGKANKHLRNAEIIDPEKHQNRVLGIRRAVGKYNKRKD